MIYSLSWRECPYGGQPVWGRARWEDAAVRETWRASLVEPLGAPQAVWGMAETGWRKKGQPAAGVARQYRGTAGRLETCQLGVLRASAGRQGPALLDGALSQPKDWTHDGARWKSARVPAPPPLAPPPPLARQMLTRACNAQVPAAWVTGASV